MADPVPPREGALIADEFRKRDRRARDEASASGTQRENAVKKLRETIAEQQDIINEMAGVVAAQVQLTQQLVAQVAFLQSASVVDDKTTITNATRGASGGISLEGVDGTYDCAVAVHTSSTGKLRVNVGAQLTGSDGVSALVGYEVLLNNSVIVGVDWARVAAAGGGLATASRESLITVPAGVDVVVRTRRGWTGGTGGLCIWGYQSLIVTKEGL